MPATVNIVPTIPPIDTPGKKNISRIKKAIPKTINVVTKIISIILIRKQN
jgi:hypothetical protein